MKLSKKSSTGLIIAVVLLVILLTLYVVFRYQRTKTTAKEIQAEKKKTEGNPVRKFYELIRFMTNFSDARAKLLTAHAMHETGIFTSTIFLNNNNAFGMHHPEKRKTTSKGENLGYAYYNSVEDSIYDLLIWLDYHHIDINKLPDYRKDILAQSYCQVLKENKYYEAARDSYTTAVVKHYNNIKIT